MPPGRDEEPTGGDPEEGPVLSPEELDIAEDERVKELDDGRYVVSSGDPIADTGSEPAGRIDGETASDRPVPPEPDTDPESAGAPSAPTPPEPESEPDAEPELTARTVHEWLTDDMGAANSRYGFDITAAFDGEVSQQRMVSNDVVTIFESLVMWYAQQIDRNTPVEEVLGILLMEANVPVRYPPDAIVRTLESTDLSPEDSIADLLEEIREDEGLQL
jgi:pyruvate/2-oxoglutarate dehydrogenase complex dihydrolipoamide acyltransferase (E2) component